MKLFKKPHLSKNPETLYGGKVTPKASIPNRLAWMNQKNANS
jgi:hypothetical protein